MPNTYLNSPITHDSSGIKSSAAALHTVNQMLCKVQCWSPQLKVSVASHAMTAALLVCQKLLDVCNIFVMTSVC